MPEVFLTRLLATKGETRASSSPDYWPVATKGEAQARTVPEVFLTLLLASNNECCIGKSFKILLDLCLVLNGHCISLHKQVNPSMRHKRFKGISFFRARVCLRGLCGTTPPTTTTHSRLPPLTVASIVQVGMLLPVFTRPSSASHSDAAAVHRHDGLVAAGRR